jgi:septal ring factor EnvC (AmiA/AmiB activator)
LKKRTKKRLFILAPASPERLGPDGQKFFGSFFQKRTAFFLILLLTAATHPPQSRTAAQRQLRAAEAQRQARLAEGVKASAALAAAEAEESRLSEQRVQASAALREVEADVAAAQARLADARTRSASAEAGLAQREADFARILPIMVRLSRYPAETLLAVPLPPARAMEGLLIARGLAAQWEQEAAALQAQYAAADRLRAEVAMQASSLARERERQKAAAAALDAQLATAQTDAGDAERALQAAAQRAAALAAQAATLRGAIAAMDAAHDRLAAHAGAEAAQLRRQQPAAAPAAELRAAALALPAGPGLPRPGQAGAGHARMVTPVEGPVLRPWGSPAEDGPSTGIIFGAVRGAFVYSPCAGRVAFAAPFRSYGKLLIIACGGGYDVVLAGLGRLDAAVGHAVHAGEPVGRMDDDGPEKRTGDRQTGDRQTGEKPAGQPGLYMELRSSGAPQDPTPFLKGQS